MEELALRSGDRFTPCARTGTVGSPVPRGGADSALPLRSRVDPRLRDPGPARIPWPLWPRSRRKRTRCLSDLQLLSQVSAWVALQPDIRYSQIMAKANSP